MCLQWNKTLKFTRRNIIRGKKKKKKITCNIKPSLLFTPSDVLLVGKIVLPFYAFTCIQAGNLLKEQHIGTQKNAEVVMVFYVNLRGEGNTKNPGFFNLKRTK